LAAYIETPLADYITTLFDLASERLKAEVAAQAGQCQRTAQKVLTNFTSKLARIRASIDSTDLSAYDMSLECRFIQMPDVGIEESYLSPLRREKMDNGEAILLRTAHIPRLEFEQPPLHTPPPTPTLPPTPTPEPTPAASQQLVSTDSELDAEKSPAFIQRGNLRPRSTMPEPPRPVAEPVAVKPKPACRSAIGKGKRASRPRTKQLPSGAVSRIGQPDPRKPGFFFTREAYNSGATGGGALQNAQVATALQTSTLTQQIAVLVGEKAVLSEKLTSLTAQLASAATAQIVAVSNAQLEERSEGARLVLSAFQDGMNAAQRLMHKKEVRPSSYDFVAPSCSSKGKSKAAGSDGSDSDA